MATPKKKKDEAVEVEAQAEAVEAEAPEAVEPEVAEAEVEAVEAEAEGVEDEKSVVLAPEAAVTGDPVGTPETKLGVVFSNTAVAGGSGTGRTFNATGVFYTDGCEYSGFSPTGYKEALERAYPNRFA